MQQQNQQLWWIINVSTSKQFDSNLFWGERCDDVITKILEWLQSFGLERKWCNSLIPWNDSVLFSLIFSAAWSQHTVLAFLHRCAPIFGGCTCRYHVPSFCWQADTLRTNLVMLYWTSSHIEEERSNKLITMAKSKKGLELTHQK